ncbi:hypothetical protein F8388_000051 [Cannabis sativa]|uniref:Zinc knuckle CX2CX4HX4C domain-containing protein n=1 Tax=Cannabis sativa TaxID=3483 RepID=A0A7J6EP07_CANSA|nr:hypothetical protein F8388_000051 [Cannabis sativa]KAF4386054.1 hypothetical protein G4B88_031189 [Cannabis sativa]
MDLELVNRLAEVLILDEGDGPVLPLNKAGVEEGKKRLDLCLIGKVIGPRPANKEGIVRAMKGVWKINHRFQDRQRVFGGGPWTIDKQLICFVKPMGLGEVSKMNFDFSSFWISINNVPLACMTKLFAREWGERIGKLEDIKLVNGTMKVRVRLNITEPLKRGLRVAIDDQGNEVSLLFQYEHLPDFFYDCGIIGHKALDCPLRDFAGDNPRFDGGRFGSWLCAPASPPRDNFRFNKKRAESPNNRPIMSMGEALKIISAVERSRPRFSSLTQEHLAPTSILGRRERDEEEMDGVVAEHGGNGDTELRVRSSSGKMDGHLSECGHGDSGNLVRVPTVVCGDEESSDIGKLELMPKVICVDGESCDNGKVDLMPPGVCKVDELNAGTEVLHVKERLPRVSAGVGTSSAGERVDSGHEIEMEGPSNVRIQ